MIFLGSTTYPTSENDARTVGGVKKKKKKKLTKQNKNKQTKNTTKQNKKKQTNNNNNKKTMGKATAELTGQRLVYIYIYRFVDNSVY